MARKRHGKRKLYIVAAILILAGAGLILTASLFPLSMSLPFPVSKIILEPDMEIGATGRFNIENWMYGDYDIAEADLWAEVVGSGYYAPPVYVDGSFLREKQPLLSGGDYLWSCRGAAYQDEPCSSYYAISYTSPSAEWIRNNWQLDPDDSRYYSSSVVINFKLIFAYAGMSWSDYDNQFDGTHAFDVLVPVSLVGEPTRDFATVDVHVTQSGLEVEADISVIIHGSYLDISVPSPAIGLQYEPSEYGVHQYFAVLTRGVAEYAGYVYVDVLESGSYVAVINLDDFDCINCPQPTTLPTTIPTGTTVATTVTPPLTTLTVPSVTTVGTITTQPVTTVTTTLWGATTTSTTTVVPQDCFIETCWERENNQLAIYIGIALMAIGLGLAGYTSKIRGRK